MLRTFFEQMSLIFLYFLNDHLLPSKISSLISTFKKNKVNNPAYLWIFEKKKTKASRFMLPIALSLNESLAFVS